MLKKVEIGTQMETKEVSGFFVVVPVESAHGTEFRCHAMSASYLNLLALSPRVVTDSPLSDLFAPDEVRWITACCRRVLESEETVFPENENDLPTLETERPHRIADRFVPRFPVNGFQKRIVALSEEVVSGGGLPTVAAAQEGIPVAYQTRYDRMGFDRVEDTIVTLTGYSLDNLQKIGFDALIEDFSSVEVLQDGKWRPERLGDAYRREQSGESEEYRACYQIRHHDGNLRWVSDHSRPWRDEKGTVIGSQGFLQDITRRKSAEDALQMERNLSETFLNTVGASVIVADSDGKILRFNRASEMLTGYVESDVKGMFYWDALITPDARSRARLAFLRFIESGFPETFEDEWITKKGERRRLLWSNSVLSDSHGNALQVIFTGVDVTQMRRIEQEYQNALTERNVAMIQRNRFFDLSQQMLTIMTFDAHRLRMNPQWERTLGYTADEMLTLPLSTFFDPENLSQVMRQLERLKAGDSITDFVTAAFHKDGSKRWLRWEAVPYLEKELVYASAHDITDERRADLLREGQNRILAKITAGANLSEIFADLLALIEEHSDNRLQGTLFLLGENNLLKLEIAGSLPADFVQMLRDFPDVANHGSCGVAIQTCGRVSVPDFSVDERTALFRQNILRFGICAAVSQPILSAVGKPLGTISVFRRRAGLPDETETNLLESIAHLMSVAIERQRADNALRDSETRYRNVVTQTTDGIWLLDFEQKTTLEANPALLRLLGYTLEEFRTLTLYDIVAQNIQSLALSVEAALEKSDIAFFDTASAIQNHLYRHKDGSLIPVEVTVSTVSAYGRDALCLTVRDVGLRQEAERRLSQVMVGARCLLWNAVILPQEENNPYGVPYRWDLQVMNQDAAQRFLPLAIIPHPNYSQAWENCIPLDDRVAMNRRSAVALQRNESAFSHEYRCRDRYGRIHWFREDVHLQRRGENEWNGVGVCTDITERKAAEVERERALLERESALSERDASRTNYHNLFRDVPAGLYRTTPNGQILMANPALVNMLGYDSFEEMSTRNLEHEGSDAAYSRAEFKARLETAGAIYGIEATWKRKDGSLLYIRENAKAIREMHGGEVLYYEGTVEDITDWKRAEEMVRWQATHDALTELPNRFELQKRLESVLQEAELSKKKVALLFLDLDSFKQINDVMGHTAGDRMLQEVARRLLRSLRLDDMVARMGGDEFIVLLPEIENVGAAMRVARKIRRVLARPVMIMGHEFTLTTSVGMSLFPADCSDAQVMMSHADLAMYQAKREGGDRLEMYEESMNLEVLRRMRLETSMRRGIAEDEFAIVYQPQFDLKTRKLIGVEALIRWKHPDLGLLPPAQFISTAEDTSIVNPLGNWVLRAACRQGARWQRPGKPLRIAVNLSARMFAMHDLPERVLHALEYSGLPAHLLDLEITESMLLEYGEGSMRTLHSLKRLGVRLLLDDFGTGYSSLMYLHRFPIDAIKIDKFFVRGIAESGSMSEAELAKLSRGGKASLAIVRAVIEMAHAVDMKTIAEGVESEVQVDILGRLGCDMVQGYLFSHPLNIVDVGNLLGDSFESISLPIDIEGIPPLHLPRRKKAGGVFSNKM